MERVFVIDSKELRCFVSRKSKKNIIFKFENRQLHVSIPKRFSLKELQKILEDRKEWVFEKLEYIEKEVNDKVLFLGETFENMEEALELGEKIIGVNQVDVYLLAEKLFFDRVKIQSTKMSLFPEKIRIKKMKSAWGICYRNKGITLNLLLLCCPISVIDYVIVHELAHLKHMNHSKDFWNEVKNYCPNYKDNQQWLKNNGTKIFHQIHI